MGIIKVLVSHSKEVESAVKRWRGEGERQRRREREREEERWGDRGFGNYESPSEAQFYDRK